MKVLGYRGIGLVSKAIRFQTRSDYSHVALETSTGEVFEAWHIGGVRKLRNFREGHHAGTEVDVFTPILPIKESEAVEFLTTQVGKDYDFRSVFRFLSRRDAPEDGKWFCSELVMVVFNKFAVPLLNLSPWAASPRDVCISPILTRGERRTV